MLVNLTFYGMQQYVRTDGMFCKEQADCVFNRNSLFSVQKVKIKNKNKDMFLLQPANNKE